MKLKPIVNQLAKFLPFNSDKFTNVETIVGALAILSVATVTTASAHGLSIGESVVITGVDELVQINSLTLDSDTLQVTCRTFVDHGLSMAMNFKDLSNNLTVDISDVPNSDYNGEFELVAVPNRLTFIYQLIVTPVGDPLGMGEVTKYSLNHFNGLRIVTAVPSTTVFEFAISTTDVLHTTDTGQVHNSWRISAAIDLERAIDSYTKQTTNDYWMFVAQNTSNMSKDRNILNDAIYTYKGHQQEWRQRLIDSLSVFVFIPTSDEISARNAIDESEDVKIALFKTLLRFKNVPQYACDEGNENDFRYFFNSSLVAAYNTSFLVYQYIFDTVFDLTYFDTFVENRFIPFRDIAGTIHVNELDEDVKTYDFDVNLDIDPDF